VFIACSSYVKSMNNTYVPKTSTENWDSVMKLVLAIAGLPAPTEIDVAEPTVLSLFVRARSGHPTPVATI
jgi:hypothetical protein